MDTPEITWSYVSAFRQAREPALHAHHQTDEVIGHLRLIYGECVMDVPAPLLEKLLNAAPWTFPWLQWFSESIRGAESMDGYASLRQRLTDYRKYDEALSVLQIADRLTAAGFVIGFDAPALVGRTMKCPDLILRDPVSKLEFHCEVSVLYSARDLVVQSHAVDRLASPLMFHGEEPIAYAGRLLRPVCEDEIEGLGNRIVWEVMELRANPSFREVIVDETLLLVIAPEIEKERIEQWANQQGIHPYSFSGSPVGGDGRTRLRLKVEDEAKQLPPHQPNLLTIFAHDLFLQFDFLELASLGAEILASYPNIAALVLMTQDFGPTQSGIVSVGDHILAVSDCGASTHHSLIIQNPSCSVMYSPTIQAALRVAFSC